MPAKDSKLGELHEKVAEVYLKVLNNPEDCTPAMLNAVNKFLKDNGIVAEVGDEGMKDLTGKAAEVLKMPFVVGD